MDLFRSVDNFEKTYFRMPKFAFKFIHQWPVDGDAVLTKTSIAVITFYWSTNIILIYGGVKYSSEVMSTDMGGALEALCPGITIITTLIKLTYFFGHRKDFAELVMNLRKHLLEDMNSGDVKKSKIITKFSSKSLKYTVTLFTFAFWTNGFYAISPIVRYLGHMYMNNDVTSLSDQEMEFGNSTKYMLKLPFELSLPYLDWNEISTTFFYKVIYLTAFLSGNSTIFGFSAIDGAFMCFCLYLSAALQSIQKDFKEAFEKYDVDFLSDTQNEELYKELSSLLQRQSYLVIMSKNLSRFYAPIILVHFLFSAVSIGVSSILLTALAQGFDKAIYVAYDLGVSTQLFIYCSGAEYLYENTACFAEICYACPWYKCNKRVRSLIQLSITGAQRGCVMEVPFFNPSLQVFQAIIRTAGSYITLLQTVV